MLGRRQALTRAAWLAGALVIFLGLFPTALHLWPGIVHTVLARAIGRSGYLLVLRDTWLWTGLPMVLALSGLAVAIGSRQKRHTVALMAVLLVGAVVIPLEQLRLETATALDKHAALGLWFAAMAAGYGIDRLTALRLPSTGLRWPPWSWGSPCCFPASTAGRRDVEFHIWPNASQFVESSGQKPQRHPESSPPKAFRAAGTGQRNVAEYATPFGHQWWRWTGLSSTRLIAAPRVAGVLPIQLRRDDLGTVALFFNVGISPAATRTASPMTLFTGIAGRSCWTLRSELRPGAGPATT